ncbi:MAG: ribonuclease HII [Candidatus Gastranaerophilales bacterium]|nr:ribonuclease HII [Candidatus Gastranaerophilales bacterium]
MSLFNFDLEEKKASNSNFIIGTDEAGRGPAAGGVWAAAVCFRENIDEKLFETLNDSKKLTPKKREVLYEPIKENSYWAIKAVTVEKIEEINILNASLLAMKYAVESVKEQINSSNILTLVDGNKLIKNFSYPQKFIIKGDGTSASIAAASILAKVSRDKYMDKIHEEFPQYDWIKNKGYLTKTHIEAIQNFGTTKYHRLSFLKNITKSPCKTEAQN